VIIPTFNRAQIVCDALESVYAQSYRPVEVVVVDDGSTDGTEAAVGEWSRLHTDEGFSVKYIAQSNRGASAARNAGFRESSGRFIQFLDSDDRLAVGALDRAVAEMQRTGADLLHFGMEFTSFETGEVLSTYLPCRGTDLLADLLERRIVGYGVAFLRRRHLCEQVGDWDESMTIAEDRDYCFRCILESRNPRKTTACYYIVRQHPGTRVSSVKKKVQGLQDRLYGETKIVNRLKEIDASLPEDLIRGYRAKLYLLAASMYRQGEVELGRRCGRLASQLTCTKRLFGRDCRAHLLWRLGPSLGPVAYALLAWWRTASAGVTAPRRSPSPVGQPNGCEKHPSRSMRRTLPKSAPAGDRGSGSDYPASGTCGTPMQLGHHEPR